jgi:uncharacterized HAD superfamily protein
MKSDFNKYMDEILDIKDIVHNDFKKSGTLTYQEFLKEELKDMEILYKHQSGIPGPE